MRTTVDIPDTLFRKAKAAAAMEGKSLKAFFLEAVKRQLREQGGKEGGGRRVSLPIVRSKKPGSLRLDGQKVADILNAEDRDAFAGR